MKKLYTFKNGPVFWPTLYFHIWNCLSVDQECDRQTEEETL